MSIDTNTITVTVPSDTAAAVDTATAAWAPIWADGHTPALPVATGWLPKVGRLGGALQRINPHLAVTAVREEGGVLIVEYAAPADRAADMVIAMYNAVLARTCDQCAAPATAREYHGWVSVRCTAHTPR